MGDAVPFARTKIVIQMSISIEIDTFNWTTGHRRNTQYTPPTRLSVY